MSFKEYRQRSGYSEKSIRVQDSHLSSFKSWCLRRNINPGDITYNQALKFIDSEKERGISRQSIIREINSIRIYFDYLLESGITHQNIIKRIRIRQNGKKVLPETLSTLQLEKIYQDFCNLPEWNHGTKAAKILHQRSTVILGLLIYQGLDSGEIARLETGHVNLNEGKIYIPSGRKSNSRTIRLQASQILPLKTYLEETRPVFETIGKERKAPVIFSEESAFSNDTVATTAEGRHVLGTHTFGPIEMELRGIYQEENARTILCAISILLDKGIVGKEAILKGFANVCETTGLRGRWEKLNDKPLVICDTGHNVAGWKFLSQQIEKQPCTHRHIVFGMVDDKDVSSVLELLPKTDTTYYWTQASTKRAIPVEKLCKMAQEHDLTGNTYLSVKEAFEAAKREAKNTDFIFVGGSSYVVADLLA